MTTPIRYRNEIDGLRAIAVVSVVLNHFNSVLLPSGYLGVDIFFVISGYVISLSLCSREFRSLKDMLFGFYARRFKRLVPALVVCVLSTTILISLFNSEPAESLKTGFFALFGLSNLYLLRIANDYFGGPSQLNAFTHTWSLGVEEQFYLVYPLILWLLLWRPAKNRFALCYAVMVAVSVLSLALFAVIGTHSPMASFYLMPLRFWELALGCLVAMRHFEQGRSPQAKWPWIQSAIVILILVALFAPPRLALVTNVAVVALTAAGLALLSPGSAAYRWLTSRPSLHIGRLSYSLYLWHWPVLVIGRYTIGVHGWSAPILVALALLLAELSYHGIEKPLRTRSWAMSNARTVLRGAGAVVAAAGFVVVFARPLEGHLYTGKPAQLAARNVDSLADTYRMPDSAYAWAGAKCVLTNDADIGKLPPVDACTLGNVNQAPHRVMVFGNSFAAAFVQGFDRLVRNDHYAVTITSAWGASPIGEVPNDSPFAHINVYYWNAVVPAMVSPLRSGDWVVLISDISGFAPEKSTPQDARNLELYRQGLQRFSTQLAGAGVRLAVLDVNSFVRDAYCRPETALPQWFAPGGGPCKFFTRATTIARRQRVDAMLHQLQQDHQLVVIDLLDLFCPHQMCTYLGRTNEVLYRDEFSHPSVEAAHEAAPVLRRLLTS